MIMDWKKEWLKLWVHLSPDAPPSMKDGFLKYADMAGKFDFKFPDFPDVSVPEAESYVPAPSATSASMKVTKDVLTEKMLKVSMEILKQCKPPGMGSWDEALIKAVQSGAKESDLPMFIMKVLMCTPHKVPTEKQMANVFEGVAKGAHWRLQKMNWDGAGYSRNVGR